jgi:hypothetical protein
MADGMEEEEEEPGRSREQHQALQQRTVIEHQHASE